MRTGYKVKGNKSFISPDTLAEESILTFKVNKMRRKEEEEKKKGKS